MSRSGHWVALLVALSAVGAVGNGAPSAQPRQPNIVMIVGDDMGYADIGVHGSKDIPTPNIDALARAGIRFTDGYVTGPHCSPTRAGLLTGRYQQRFGHEFNLGAVPVPNAGLPVERDDHGRSAQGGGIPHRLVRQVAPGITERLHPMSRGFDEFYGFLGGDHSYFESTPTDKDPLYEGRTPVDASGYLTDVLTDRAVAFIGARSRAPSSSISPSTPSIRRCRRPRNTWRDSRGSTTKSAAATRR